MRRKVRISAGSKAATKEREMDCAETLFGHTMPEEPAVAVGKTLKQMVPLLWSSNYTELAAMETSELMSRGVLESAVFTPRRLLRCQHMSSGA